MQVPLTGRTRELKLLRDLLNTASHRARFALVEGEPGIGKTRLLHAALEDMPSDVVVLHGRGLELERDRPFGTIADALDLGADTDEPARRAAADLLGNGSVGRVPASTETAPGLDAPAHRFRVVQALVELVAASTDEGQVVLVIEDLHWVDDASLLVLEQLVRRLVDRPLTIVATTRPTPRSVVLDAITTELSEAGTLLVTLDRLADDEVRELVTSSVGAPPGPTLASVVAGAGGNPLYITELLTALHQDDAIRVENGIADVVSPVVPASLDLAILGRLGYLDVDSLDTLRMASTLGSRFTVDDLAVVLDEPATRLLRSLREPMTAGLLHPEGAALVFRHDLVRAVIYRDLPLSARRALHVQAARRLAAAGRPATQVATHYLAGAEPGDAGAIAWLLQAAEDALPRSPAIAAELLEGAVALAPVDHPDRDRALVTLLIAFTWSGRHQDGAEVLEELDARPLDADLRATLDLAAGRMLHLLGREREAIERYDRVIEAARLPDHHHARAVADKASAHVMVGEVDEARRAAEGACELGRALGDDPALCGGLAALSYVANVEGRTQDALALGRQALALAQRSPDRETARRYPEGYLSVILTDADELEEGFRLFDHGRRAAESLGDGYQAPVYHFGQGMVDFFAGRLEDAEVAIDTALRSADGVGFRNLHVWALAVAARIAIRRDQLSLAAEHLDTADAEIARVGPRMGADWLLWCRGLLQEAEGDVEAAAATLGFGWQLMAQLGLISQGRMLGPDLVRVLLAVGDTSAAAEVVASLEAAAERGRTNGAHAVAAWCRGVLDADAEVLLRAVGRFRASPRPLDRADAMRDAATCLAAEGRQDEARELLREALELAAASGAVRDERAAEAGLRELGVVLGRRGSRSRPSVGWEALTATELEVARLAAEGLSNPEIARRRFVSPRTIESHLSNAFAKLGISSRVALAAEVIRHDR